ncbi:hypothetical protein J6590_013127, partial [Homalodisca vitripennis]
MIVLETINRARNHIRIGEAFPKLQQGIQSWGKTCPRGITRDLSRSSRVFLPQYFHRLDTYMKELRLAACPCPASPSHSLRLPPKA